MNEVNKQSRILRISRHHNRRAKLKKANTKPRAQAILDRDEIDIALIDLVLKSLYHNSHIDVLHVENDIYKNANVEVPYVEAERLWEVMLSSGLVNPVAGFGNAGKLKLSRSGYQLMAQYGGYAEYISTIKAKNNNQPVAAAPETKEESDTDCQELTETDDIE